ncbi:MAG: hypothetical protein LUG47_02415 [Clostridiales bacterium]|nr:hypothetical protein [Clostridiales bacterium]
MAETILPGPVPEGTPIREATCIHTQKIYDSCQSRDCMEDLRLYPEAGSQTTLENAQSVRSAQAELLYVDIQVDQVGYNQGFYTVDLQYFYRITADAYTAGTARPSVVTGLATFSKRCMLFGSQGTARTFSSAQSVSRELAASYTGNLPTAVVEAVDPIVLNVRLYTPEQTGFSCDCAGETSSGIDIPDAIRRLFDEELVTDNDSSRQLLLTLGQFSLLRLERDSQLLIPIYDYCVPDKECQYDGPGEDDPCTLFQRVDFPVNEFFPPATADGLDASGCNPFRTGCGLGRG